MMSEFNSKDVLEEIVEKLSSRATARPFPHLRVIGPTPYSSTQRSAIFTNFTQNPPHVVGYKIAFSSYSDSAASWSVTEFNFTVPRTVNPADVEAFEDFTIRMAINVIADTGELTVDSSLRGRVAVERLIPDDTSGTSSLTTYRSDFRDVLSIKYFERPESEVESSVSLSLHFEKKIEKKAQYWTSEFKAKNLSESVKFEDARLVERNKVSTAQVETDEDGTYFEDLPEKECTYLITGYLLEFDLKESIEGGRLYFGERNSPVLRTFNTVATQRDNTNISFSDHYIGEEHIHQMKVSKQSIREFSQQLSTAEGLSLDPILCEAFQQVFERGSVDDTYLRTFQEEAVLKILSELTEPKGLINIVSVRTAGGKTEAFLIPLLQYCINHLHQRGVKALVFYPTKALANDQAKRLFRALYFINKLLVAEGRREVTMALYHGDITAGLTDGVEWVPFKCVKGCDVHLTHERRQEQNIFVCPQCAEFYSYCFLTRADAHIRLPDILITNPDTLSYMMARYADRHSILGRRVRGCTACGWTSPSANARVCYGRNGECKAPLVSIIPECSPEVFIFDEVHLFSGAFGMNVAAFNRRIEQMVRAYRKTFHLPSPYVPVYIASSATIRNPERFAASFFGKEPEQVRIIPKDPVSVLDELGEGHTRYNLFLLPRAYRAKQTTSLAVKYLLDISQIKGIRPRILAFVNSLKDCNDLILEAKSRADTSKFNIDGHNTQYSKEQRSDREVRFNKGELQVLFATSTLEVGIDFEDVNALIVFGPPFHFNDYLQRIGRAGRTSDAVVLTVCKANQAIDYWYFEHAREIISQPHAFTHRIPIGDDNALILNKALKLAIFDYAQQRPDVLDLTEKSRVVELLFDKSRGVWKADVEAALRLYLAPLIHEDQANLVDEVLGDMRSQILGFQGDPGWSLLESVHLKMNQQEGLDNLRSSERSISVQYTFGMASNR